MRVGSEPAGFTLIEMIVVIVVMAMVAGLVLVKQPWRSRGLNTEMTVRALIDGLRLARSRAIVQDREVAVVTAANGFTIDGRAPWKLPPDEAFSNSEVVFTPDGGSTGGTIVVASGQRRIVVTINWLTGRVNSAELKTP